MLPAGADRADTDSNGVGQTSPAGGITPPLAAGGTPACSSGRVSAPSSMGRHGRTRARGHPRPGL
jgi:hypothetical protein